MPQGNVLSPLLCYIYTAGIPEHPATILASFGEDKGIFVSNANNRMAFLIKWSQFKRKLSEEQMEN